MPPQGERIDRLHVVMAVNQHCRTALLLGPARDDDGMARRRVQRGFEADGGQFVLSHSAQARTWSLYSESVEMLAKRRKSRY